MDLQYLVQQLNQQDLFSKKFQRLNQVICELLEDFSLVSFYPLCIEDKHSVTNLVHAVDKANGYVFGGLEPGNDRIFETAARVGSGYLEDVSSVQERFLGDVVEKSTVSSDHHDE